MSRNMAHPGAKEAAALRRERALRMRVSGASYRQIAAQLGVSHTQIERDVAQELSPVAAARAVEAPYLLDLELARLDMAGVAIAHLVQKGQLDAFDRWLRLCESRRKLLGLDAPQRVDYTLSIRQEAERLAAESGADVDAVLREFEAIVGARR